jgi:MGT family glycosyltransferase
MSSHVAFFNIPAVGHVYPTLAVAAELVARGHRVSYASIERRRPVIEATGASLVPYETTRPKESDPSMVAPDRGVYLAQAMLTFIEEAAHTLPQFEAAFADDMPDVVAFDRLSFAGRIFALKHKLPSVQLWPMLVSAEYWSLFHDYAPYDESHPIFLTYAEKLDGLLRAHGLDIATDDFLFSPPDAGNISFYPRSFQFRGELHDPKYTFVGPCPRPRDAVSGWTPPNNSRPVLLISLGSVYNALPGFYASCVAAFADSPWHVVLAVGERTDPASLVDLPTNIEVHQVVPQLEVLAHATVFLSHGGLGGIMEALSEKVPLVILPQTVEQESNALRLEQLGLGRWLPADFTPEVLRAAVEDVASDIGMATRLAAMRNDIETAGGAAAAADVVDVLLAQAGQG